MSDLSEMVKEIDPDYKKFCEETLIITREDFNKKISELSGINSRSHFIEVIEVGSVINKLWHHLKGDD